MNTVPTRFSRAGASTLVELPAVSRRKAVGFTLVELLVVIGIIALLISILLPSLNRARASANSLQCLSMLRQYGMADLTYVNANRGWHLPGYWGDRSAGSPAYQYNRTWTGLYEFRKAMGLPIINDRDTANKGHILFNYVTTKWYCPAATTRVESFYAPMNLYLLPLHYSYGMNVEGVDTDAGGSSLDLVRAPQANPALNTPSSPYGSFAGFRSGQVKRPAEKLFMADGLYIVINMQGSGPRPGWKGKESNYDFTKEITNNGQNGFDTTRTTAWRHRGSANVLFFDGHAASLRKDEIYDTDRSTGKIIGNVRLWKVME
jgi:prepilin-type processing-associated H-X9-DG protein/prepilin-type N-terminal cleavage/methylation domain-containing protein